MLLSKTFIPTLRDDPAQAECASHRLLLRAAYLYMLSSGMYVYLPLGLRVLNKLCSLIRKHMNDAGAVELLMTALQPLEIWQKTGRDKVLQDVMLKFQDRKGRKLCLGPTHEEEITEIAKRYIASYKQLPVTLYQIQTKYRDEARPRYGLVRSCEFIMKDAYSFTSDQAGLDEIYEKMLCAYKRIFKECGLDFVTTLADSGAMGGNYSHEFMAPADIGEDILYYCPQCAEYYKTEGNCPSCGKELSPKRMIEAGHIFKLGTKYSSAIDAAFLDRQGKRNPVIMGCYGIGVSRVLSAVVEQNHDEKGIIWPRSLAPYDLLITVLDVDNETLFAEGLKLQDRMEEQGFSVLLDDRKEKAGVKFNDGYLIGIPYIVIIGRNFLKTKKLEVENRLTREKIECSVGQLPEFLK